MNLTVNPARVQDPAFEPEFIAALEKMFEHDIPFNQVLGIQLTSITAQHVASRVDMQPELIGHFIHKRLHGGVISATLDAIGGLAVMAAMGARHIDLPVAERMAHFMKLGTIDLRVDFMRPAVGGHFIASGEALRLGSRVANTRMAFHDERGKMVAAGSAAYIVS